VDRILLAIATITATSFLSSFCSTDFVSGLIPCVILHLRGQSLSVLHEFQPFENALHQTTTNKGQLQCDMAVSSHLFFLSLQLNILTEIRARQQQQQQRKCLITTHKLAAFPGSSLQELVLQCLLRVFCFQ
jgi:hypothetical protein